MRVEGQEDTSPLNISVQCISCKHLGTSTLDRSISILEQQNHGIIAP